MKGRSVIARIVMAFVPACLLGACADQVAPDSETDYSPPADASARSDSLETIVAFSDPQLCQPSARYQSLLAAIAPTDEYGRPNLPYQPDFTGFPSQFEGAADLTSNGNSHEATLTVEGDWHGLQLTRITVWWTEESDHQGVDLHFAETSPRVIEVLDRLGFALGPNGSRVVEAEVSTFLHARPEGVETRFTCSTG